MAYAAGGARAGVPAEFEGNLTGRGPHVSHGFRIGSNYHWKLIRQLWDFAVTLILLLSKYMLLATRPQIARLTLRVNRECRCGPDPRLDAHSQTVRLQLRRPRPGASLSGELRYSSASCQGFRSSDLLNVQKRSSHLGSPLQ